MLNDDDQLTFYKSLRETFYYQYGTYISKSSKSLKTRNTSCKKGYDSIYFIDGIDKKIETKIPIIITHAIN